eukprot:1573496-Pleurochrysis_carterae.AAC.6
MADDDMPELSKAEKLKIASGFILHSPPGQTQKVVDDVRTLVGSSTLNNETLVPIVMRVNKEKFLSVSVPGTDYSVLLTPFGELEDGCFLDPKGKQQLLIDHVKQSCTGTKPLSAGHKAKCGADKQRESVDAAMIAHAEKFLPGATVTTYGSEEGGKTEVNS